MRDPRWHFELEDVDAAGAAYSIGRLRAFAPVISYAVNKPTTITTRLRNEDPILTKIQELRSRVKAYRVPAWEPVTGQPVPDAILRAYGHVIAATDTFGNNGGVDLAVASPQHLLGRRVRQSERVFAAVDQGLSTKQLIDDENTRYPTGIRTTTYTTTTGVTRTITTPRDKNVVQAITEMVDAFGGFDLEIVPVDSDPAVMGDLKIHYPSQGIDNLGVFLEHGAGKRNIIGGTRTRSTDNVSSHVHVLGRTDGAAQFRSDRADTSVTTAYRALLDSVETYSDIGNQAMLDTLADFLIGFRKAPRELLRLELAPTAGIRPFDDFNLGDRITARIKEGRVDIDGSVRVWGFEITPTSTGEERLTALTIEPGA